MIGLQDLLGEVEQCLQSAQGISIDLAGPNCMEHEVQQELQWIERQIAAAEKYLQALLDDLAAGMSVAELGFGTADDLLEAVQDLASDVAALKARYQAISQERQR